MDRVHDPGGLENGKALHASQWPGFRTADRRLRPSTLNLWKLLTDSGDFSFGYGTRRVPELIWTGADMGSFLRWGNSAVAKLISGPAARSLHPHIGCLSFFHARDYRRRGRDDAVPDAKRGSWRC